MNNMKIGYIRVSTEEQKEDRQVDLLKPVCDEIHIEKRSAVGQSRPVFEAVFQKLDAGDTLVVWSLDRAFRSARDALNIEAHLKEHGVTLQIVSLGVDTATADGKLAFTMVAAVAEHERSRLSERTKQGLAVARKNGKRLTIDLSNVERGTFYPSPRSCLEFSSFTRGKAWSKRSFMSATGTQ